MSKWVTSIRSRISRFHSCQKGAEAMEYLIVTGMVIISTVAAWRFLGQKIMLSVNKIAAAIDQATSSGTFPPIS